MPRYRLDRRDNGVFFWQDNNDPSQQGTLETTDKQEAERLLDSMNDADLNRRRMLHGEWTVGDLVQLKSGGPAMTVVSVYPDNRVFCKWMRGSKLQESTFPNAALRVPQPDKRLRRTAGKPRRKSPRE